MRLLLAILLAALLAAPAGAQLFGDVPMPRLAPSAPVPRLLEGRPAPVARPPSTVTSGTANAARTLAASYPAAKRGEMEQLFATMLAQHAKLEAALAVQPGDVAGAAALLVIASYEVYRNTTVDERAYKPVIDQLRGALQAAPAFASASASQRRELYEQMAIVGMFVLGTKVVLAQQSDATMARNLRAAAKGYLALLGADPDKVQITSAGLVAQDASGGAQPAHAPAPAPAPSPTQAPSPAAAPSPDIVTVGSFMDGRYDFNNNYTYTQKFVVLFKSGDALRGMSGLSDPAGLDAHRQKHPNEWTKWRQANGKLELQSGTTWRKLEAFYEALPRGFKLSRSYQKRTTGGGSYTSPGVSFTSWHDVSFEVSGRFTVGGGSGSSGGDVNVRRREAARSGTYEISGYTLLLRFDDGSTSRHTIITDAKSQKVIYIDGIGYTS